MQLVAHMWTFLPQSKECMPFPVDEKRLAVAMFEALTRNGWKQMITGYNIGALVVTEAALTYFKEYSKLALNDERLHRLTKNSVPSVLTLLLTSIGCMNVKTTSRRSSGGPRYWALAGAWVTKTLVQPFSDLKTDAHSCQPKEKCLQNRLFHVGANALAFLHPAVRVDSSGLRIQYIDMHLLGIKEVMLSLRGSVPISGRPGIKSSPSAIKKLTKSIAVKLVMYWRSLE